MVNAQDSLLLNGKACAQNNDVKKQLSTIRARIPGRYLGAGILSAALLVLSFPTYSVWGLGFVGMVPLLIAITLAKSWKEAAWAGFACMTCFILFGYQWVSFVATNFGGLPWIAGKVVLVLFSLFAEVQFLVFALAAVFIFPRAARAADRFFAPTLFRIGFAYVFLPLFYIGLDALNPKIFPSSFGHVLYSWLAVAQLAEFFGVYGLTLPVVIANFAVLVLTLWLIGVLRRETVLARKALPGPVSALIVLVLLAVFFVRADSWGRHRIEEIKALENSYRHHFKFSVIQANIGDVDKLASEHGYEPAIKKVLTTFHDMSLESIKNFHPDLVIWPETSWPFLYTHLLDSAANQSGSARDSWIKDFLVETKTPLFFGSYSSMNKRDFNSAFLIVPEYHALGIYRKSILLAFGEYVPLGPLAPLVQDLIPSIADFGRGQGPMVFDLNGVKLAPQICYEGIVPEHSRVAANMGADVLLNITNDSWFGQGTEPWLHLHLTAFRSIELRRPMIRSTNTGISTLIDSTGEMRYRTRLFEPAHIDAEIGIPDRNQKNLETFYARHGEIFANLCSYLALLVLVALSVPQFLAWRRKAKNLS